MLPSDMEVDHINDISTDDRLCNLQLLTRAQNIRKRDERNYKAHAVTDTLISDIKYYLGQNYARFEIADKLNLSKGHIRYLINTYIPEYSRPEHIDRNFPDILSKYQAGARQKDIADEYGVDQATISRLLVAHGIDKKAECKKAIADMLSAGGYSYSEIARQLGCDCSNVIYYMKTFFKEEFDRRREAAALEAQRILERDLDFVAQIRSLMEADSSLTINDAAKLTPYPNLDPYTLIKRHDKEILNLGAQAARSKSLVTAKNMRARRTFVRVS